MSSDLVPVGAKTGDFIVVATRGGVRARLVSWAIQAGTDAPVNHAAFYDAERQCFIEAAPGGVRRVSLDSYAPSMLAWSTGRVGAGELTDQQRVVAGALANSFADANRGKGVPYGFADIACIAIAQRRTGSWIDPKVPIGRQPWLWRAVLERVASLKHLICSQLVDATRDYAHAPLFNDGRWEGLVSPGDLWRRIGSPALGSDRPLVEQLIGQEAKFG